MLRYATELSRGFTINVSFATNLTSCSTHSPYPLAVIVKVIGSVSSRINISDNANSPFSSENMFIPKGVI